MSYLITVTYAKEDPETGKISTIQLQAPSSVPNKDYGAPHDCCTDGLKKTLAQLPEGFTLDNAVALWECPNPEDGGRYTLITPEQLEIVKERAQKELDEEAKTEAAGRYERETEALTVTAALDFRSHKRYQSTRYTSDNEDKRERALYSALLDAIATEREEGKGPRKITANVSIETAGYLEAFCRLNSDDMPEGMGQALDFIVARYRALTIEEMPEN